MTWNRWIVLTPMLGMLAACSTNPARMAGEHQYTTLARSEIADALFHNTALGRSNDTTGIYEVLDQRYANPGDNQQFVERGEASYYASSFQGRRTSSGEIYDKRKLTAAHRSLPLSSHVRVINLDNGRSTVVKVNDRGPFHSDRIIDLSYAAATKLGIARQGTARVEIQPLDSEDPASLLRHTAMTDAAASSKAIGPHAKSGATLANLIDAERKTTELHAQSLEDVGIRAAQQEDGELLKVCRDPLNSTALADTSTTHSRASATRNTYPVLD